MKNQYNNLDFCINMYNDYIDSKDYDKYRIEPIVISEIDIDNILKPDNFDFKNILDNLEFYKKLDNKYIYFSNNSDINYEVNISKYSGNKNLLSTKENIGLVFHYVLSELITLNKLNNTEGILINLMNFSVKKKEIKNIIKDFGDIDDDDLLLISIFERRDKTITLSDFIKKNKLTLDDYKIIFFKILFILEKLTDKYKNFRHNNLNLDSIRITNNINPKKIKIKINNDNNHSNDSNDSNDSNYNIEFIDKFIIKFTNFENAYSDSITKKTSKNISKENPYYDIHYFFSSFMNFCLNNNIIVDDKISKFIDQIIPEKYRTYENKKYKLDEEYYLSNQTEFISAKDLIKNIFFNDIINNNNIVNMNLSASPMSVSDSSLQNFNKKENKINYDINSLTESSNNNFRMFAKNINYKNKKTYSQSNNIKDTMIHGTRRLYVPTKNVIEGNLSSDILSNVEKNERNDKRNDKKNRRKHVITEEEDTDDDVDVEVDEESDDKKDKRKKSTSKVSSNEESSDEESSDEKKMSRNKKSKKSKKSKKYDSESSLTSLSSDINKVNSKLANSRSQKEYSNFNASSINKEPMGMSTGMNMNQGNGINKIGELLGHSANNMQAPNGLPMTAFGNSQMGMPEMGMQQMPGMGMPEMGMQQMPGMGMPGMGMQQMPGMGMQQMPGMGMQQMPGMGMPQIPGMGMPQMGMPASGVQSINLSESGLNMPQNNGPQSLNFNEPNVPHINNSMQSLNLNEPNINHAMQPQQGGSSQRGSSQRGSIQREILEREFLQNKKVQLKLKKDFFF